jgi:IstB-like ATP binding protein
MSVSTPAAPPLPAELERLLRRLRLPYVRNAAPEVIATANSQRWEHAEVLRVLLAEEAAGRDRATTGMRRRASGLPAGKTFDAWEAGACAIPQQTQNALRTLEWIDRAEVLCVCGPSRADPPRRADGRTVAALGPSGRRRFWQEREPPHVIHFIAPASCSCAGARGLLFGLCPLCRCPRPRHD